MLYLKTTLHYLKVRLSEKETMKAFDEFPVFFGLRPDKSRCEDGGKCVLKGVKISLCRMEIIKLSLDSIKVLVTYFSQTKHVKNKEKVLKFWRTRNLSSEGDVTIFKALVVFEIIYPASAINPSTPGFH